MTGSAGVRLRDRCRACAAWLDQNIEKAIMLPLYAFMAAVIGGEGILRYLTNTQSQWGGAAAIQAFIFMSWIGCAHHVGKGSHLSLDGIRANLSPRARTVLSIVDDVLWLGLSTVVVVYSTKLAWMQAGFESTLEGTDSIPLWLVTAAVPASWLLIAFRALQHLNRQLRPVRSAAPATKAADVA